MTSAKISVSDQLLLRARFSAVGTELGESLDKALHQAAEHTSSSPHVDAIQELTRIALGGSVGTILPFHLDDLDLSVASILLKGMPAKRTEGIIFGSASLVNAGFVAISENRYAYRDCWCDPSETDHRQKSSIGVRMVPANRSAYEAAVQKASGYQPVARTGDGEDPCVLLEGIDLSFATKCLRQATPTCHLIDPHAERPKRDRLHGVRVDVRADQRALRVMPSTPEAVIQLSASNQQQRWLEMVCGDLRSVFPVPDISDARSVKLAWVSSLVGDDSYFFARHGSDVEVSAEVTRKCCRAFRWFVIHDSWEMVKTLAKNG